MRFRIGALAIVVSLMLLAKLRYAPPVALDHDAPPGAFSAARARAMLARVLGDERPHPVGSEANAAVRERLIAELRRLNLEPELESAFSCGAFGACAEVVNVLARVPGSKPGAGVLLASHYDSVGAGPGACDDGAGVAAMLEIARALRVRQPARRVLLLFTDGEEAGLLGARLFVKRRALLDEVRAVVNLEARGTTGPSMMFETSAGNADLVKTFAASVPRPVTASLFNAVYRSLPNDTDFTVFRNAGLAGTNLAFIGGMGRYHTELDDLAHLDGSSLQHLGETALAATHAFASNPPAGPAASDAVFFDVLALFVVRWKKSWTLALSSLATLLVTGALARLFSRRELPLGALAKSGGIFAGALVVSILLGLGLEKLWRLSGALPSPWIASPAAAHVATALAGLLPVVTWPALAFDLEEEALFAASALGFTLLAWILGIFLPEASQLALAPALFAGALGCVSSRAGALALLSGTLLVLLPLALLLYDAVGFASVAATSALWSLVCLPLLAPLSRLPFGKRASLATACAFLIAAAVAALTPAFSRDLPQRVTLAHYRDADTGRARWLIDAPWGSLPTPLASAQPWRAASGHRVLPWAWSSELLEAPAEPLTAGGPEVEVSREANNVTLRIRSRPEAWGTFLLAPSTASLGSVFVEGQPTTFRWTGTERAYMILGKQSGFEVKLVVQGPLRLLVADFAPGLPPFARALRARRGEHAASSQYGDVTVVSRTLTL